MKCKTCKHWVIEYDDDDDPDDAMGHCAAIQSLPYAFRWAWREVTWTRASDPPEDDPCSHWTVKE